jgi:hypothetical protein
MLVEMWVNGSRYEGRDGRWEMENVQHGNCAKGRRKPGRMEVIKERRRG